MPTSPQSPLASDLPMNTPTTKKVVTKTTTRTLAAGIALAMASSVVASPQTTAVASGAPAESSARQTDDPVVLDTLIVVGDAFSDTDGLRARQSSTGTRFPVDTDSLPNTIRIIPQELMDATQATLPQDVTRFVSGVQPLPGFGTSTGYVIRGFFANYETLQNGVRTSDNPGDLSNVERIEVLKGPIGSLYGGTGAFAGNVNIITKRPLDTFAGDARLLLGSDAFRRFDIDLGGPLGSEALRYRLTAAAEDAGSFRDNTTSDKQVVSPSIELDLGERGTLRIDTSLMDRSYTFDEGLPAAPITFALPLSRTVFAGDSRQTDERYRSLGFESTIALTDQLDWRFAGMGSEYDIDIGDSRMGVSLRDDGRTLDRSTFEGPQQITRHTLQSDLIWRTDEVGDETVLLFGFERFQNRYDYDASGRTLPALDLLTNTVLPGIIGPLEPQFAGFSAYDGEAVYAQAYSRWNERLTVLAGLRHDRQTNRGEFNGSGSQVDDSESSPRLGLSWALSEDSTLFANWATSFSPNFALDRDGDVFPADQVRQVEVGLRQSLADDRAVLTVAAFDILRSNVVIPDITEFAQSVAAGEQSSRGAEIDLTGRLGERVELIATYAYTRTRVEEKSDPNFGQSLAAAPKHSGSMFARYRLSGIEGLIASAGIVHASAHEATLPNSIRVPESTRLDLGLDYGWNDWRATLTISNVTDERDYVSNLFSLFPQPPRQVFLGLTRSL
jgi:iron complex outermembrane receptor protein